MRARVRLRLLCSPRPRANVALPLCHVPLNTQLTLLPVGPAALAPRATRPLATGPNSPPPLSGFWRRLSLSPSRLPLPSGAPATLYPVRLRCGRAYARVLALYLYAVRLRTASGRCRLAPAPAPARSRLATASRPPERARSMAMAMAM